MPAFPSARANIAIEVEHDSDVVYEVDRDLHVVECNAAWAGFASENGGARISASRSVLDAFSGSARVRWSRLYERLLSGAIPEHSERFLCPSPTVRRTYLLTIRPLHDEDGRVDRLVHRTRLLEEQPALRKDRRAAAIRRGMVAEIRNSRSVLRIADVQRPLEDVGGDLIWSREFEDGRRVVVLADVMGHGALAARVASLIGSLLDRDDHRSPGDAILTLNNRMIEEVATFHDETIFATGLYLELDPGPARLRVGNFAHLGLILSEKGLIDPPAGLPIGLFPADEPWPETTLGFSELGRRLLAYTDGIVEQFDDRGAMFGATGLQRAFLETLPRDLPSSLGEIMEGGDAFRGHSLVKDDQTLLAIELDDVA